MCVAKNAQMITWSSVRPSPVSRPKQRLLAPRPVGIRVHRTTAGQMWTLEMWSLMERRTPSAEIIFTICDVPPTTRTIYVETSGRHVILASLSDLSVCKTSSILLNHFVLWHWRLVICELELGSLASLSHHHGIFYAVELSSHSYVFGPGLEKNYSY